MSTASAIRCILAGLLGSILWCACSTTSATLYHAEKSSLTTAKAALEVWRNYVKEFNPPKETEQKVKNAYEKYRSALRVSADISRNMHEFKDEDPELVLQRALDCTASALTELIMLVQKETAK